MEGFSLEEKEPALQPNRPVNENDVSLVSRREGGTTWISVLYIRKHLVEVQKKLDDFIAERRKDQLYITGPPGCGKTCFLYLWARRVSVLERKRLLIVQFREKQSCFIWIREAGGPLWRMEKTIDSEDLRQAVKNVLNKNDEEGTPFDLCIHDGVLDKLALCTSMLGTLNNAVTNKVIGKVIHVSSLAFNLSTGGQLLDETGTIWRLSMDSWHMQDYEIAAGCEEFLSQVTRTGGNQLALDLAVLADAIVNEDDKDGAPTPIAEAPGDLNPTIDTGGALQVVKAKYFFAGGSARFMFQFPLHQLRDALDERIRTVTQTHWQFFAQGSVASGTPSAVNTLMQQFKKVCTPVSKYVLFHAYDRCRTELVKSVRAAANSTSNPTLKGWAFELEQIHLIRTSLDSDNVLKYVTNGKGWSFRPTSEVEFDGTHLTMGEVGNSAVIWCQKWNQGCFDIGFYANATLITAQFILQAKHTLELNCIRRLRKALVKKDIPVTKVVHVGVRESNWEVFQFDNATDGTGQQIGTEDPEFEIVICRSPLLQGTSKTDFKCDFDETAFDLKKMYALGRKRGRQSP